jgi:hypothetical protein
MQSRNSLYDREAKAGVADASSGHGFERGIALVDGKGHMRRSRVR